jgi:YidC/Oxa1 family membrane protein insertase
MDRCKTLSEIQNPQNQPGMDRSVIMIFLVAIVMLVVAQQFLVKPKQPVNNAVAGGAKTAAPASGAAPQSQSAKSQTANSAAATPQSAKLVAPPPSKPVTATVQAAAESTTVVENDLYRITFSNRGAQVKSWILKKYADDNGEPLDLVHQKAATQFGYPLSLWTSDEGLRSKLNSALYVVHETNGAGGKHDLTFEYAEGDLEVKKEFHFDESYVVGVKTSVQQGGRWVTALPAWPAGLGDALSHQRKGIHPKFGNTGGLPAYADQRLDYVATGQDIKRLKLDKKGEKISNGRLTTGDYQWVGATDSYFGAIFLPVQPKDTTFAELRNSIEIPRDTSKPEGEQVKAEVLGVAAGTLNAPSALRLFAGPKAEDVLESVHSANGADLHAAIDFGFFGIIGRPLFVWVRWTQQHWTPNWGWTIILVTVLINVALLPLRISQIKSSMKMQKVAPQMQAIQAKYKKYKLDDPRRKDMQKEMAALYQEHGVNPIGGCLPVIVQMPFLFAFYEMLRNAIELRHAPWLYLNDLSAPDPYHIIPVATIVLMVAMQRMMPMAGMSKQQQRMMNMFTPIMFAAFTWSVASGLGLYIVAGTVVQIIQQAIMNQTEVGREMRALAEKRALKAAEKKH